MHAWQASSLIEEDQLPTWLRSMRPDDARASLFPSGVVRQEATPSTPTRPAHPAPPLWPAAQESAPSQTERAGGGTAAVQRSLESLKAAKHRLLAASGIVYVLSVVITVFSIPPVPAAGAPAQEVVSYYVTHREGFLVANYLSTLELVLLLTFIGYLCHVLRRAEGPPGTLSMVAFGTACAYVAIVLVMAGVTQTLPLEAAKPSNANVLLATSDQLGTLGATRCIAAAWLIGTVSLSIFQHAALPRWVSIVGWVAAAVLVLTSLTLLITSGPLAAGGVSSSIAFVVFALWLLVVSMVMTVKAEGVPQMPSAG